MKRILVFAAAVASAMSLRADSSQWELVSLLPFPVSESAGEWQNSSLKSMYQTGTYASVENQHLFQSHLHHH